MDRMTFDIWLANKGLSTSSVKKYYTAIRGPLSEWGIQANIISGSILEIIETSHFSDVARQIQMLPIFLERNKIGHQMYSGALNQYFNYLLDGINQTIEKEIEAIIEDIKIPETEKISLITARIGQGQYRKDLVGLWKKCSVTGYDDCGLLIASHIKPWSHSTHTERLDKFNGLLLLPNIDVVFDKGFISFDIAGKILLSSDLKHPDILGITEDMQISLNDNQALYMNYHREKIFMN